MGKNWLIRTKSNHILGPVSKEKVQELFKNGTIRPDDEVCSGNGFWFFIREEEMVEKYLMNDEVQSFNPVSEAKNVLTVIQGRADSEVPARDDITLVGGISLSMLNSEESPPEVMKPKTSVEISPVPELKKKNTN